MAYYKTSSVEKPYELIPFASKSVKREQPVGHEALEQQKLRTGRMLIYLFPRVPIQVASGRQYVRKGEVLQEEATIRRYDEEGKARREPVLPGSSIKGAIRSLTELLSPSCVPLHSGQTRRHIPSSHKPCTDVNQLCPACRLFGMSGAKNDNYLGQVHIEDAIMQKGKRTVVHTPQLWTPARGRDLPERYLNGREVSGRKIYYHSETAEGVDGRVALQIRSHLQTWLHFENLTKGELGLLIAAWGLHPNYAFLPKIGAAKPVGMGTVEVHLRVIEIYAEIKQNGRLGGKRKGYDGKRLEKIIPTLLEAAKKEGLLLEEALRNVVKVLKPENLARPALEGNY